METRLTFVRLTGRQKGNQMALYRCLCGVECEKRVWNVLHGMTHSCGCMQRENGKWLADCGLGHTPEAIEKRRETWRRKKALCT